jgi:HK97 family phage major capsid protein
MADEIKQVMEALDRVEGKMGETAKSNEAELKRLGDEQTKLSRQLMELQQKGIQHQDKPEEKTAGENLVEAENFKAFRDGSAQKARVEIAEQADKKEEAVNPITTPTGGIVQAYRRPGIMPGAFRPLTIEGLFPSLPISTNAFEYVQENEAKNVNGAAFVAEGAQKPFGSTDFEAKTGTVKTIAHLARISKQLMADAPALVAYINQRLVYGVDLVVEDQLVTGDGTGQNLSGILHDGNYTVHGATKANLGKAPTIFDLILFAKAKVEDAFFRPNVILLNPIDWTSMLMEKNASGDYYLGHPASVAPKYLWGLPVWTTPAITQGKFLVGDFNAAATLWTRQGMTVEMFEQDVDNVQKNLVTIRAERRLGFGVERAAALCGGDLTLPIE